MSLDVEKFERADEELPQKEGESVYRLERTRLERRGFRGRRAL